jgi:hypothetical protein
VTPTATAVLATPLGPFAVTATDRAVVAARWVDDPATSSPVSGIVSEFETINATGREGGAVLAADGALTGYGGAPGAGGRLDLKKALLEIEQGALQQRLW